MNENRDETEPRRDFLGKAAFWTTAGTLGFAALETLISDQDAAYIDDPCTVRRTIFVPAQNVSPLDFNLTPATRRALYDSGLQAGNQFLATWNFEDYLTACRAGSRPDQT